MPNLKFVSSVIFELLAFNAHNLRGHVTLATPPLRKIFSGVMTRLSLRACLPNWKFVPLDILELLAFNAQKFTESRDPGHAPFSKKIFRGHKTVIWICQSSGSNCCLEKSN